MRGVLKNIREQSKSFLIFNYAERRGIVGLVLLIMIIEGANAFLPQIVKQKENDYSVFEAELRKFEIALAQPDTFEAKKEYKPYPKKKQYPDYKKKKSIPVKPPVMIEINTADTAELISLYGIGKVFAERIHKYRGLLGGFYSKDQLLEVYGMDSIRFDQFKGQVEIDTNVLVKIPINEEEFKTLLRHPYLDYETVKAIVNYRQKNDSIPNDSILRCVIAYDPAFEKIRHYVDYRITNME